MANITVSTAVDTMMQSATNSAIRSNIGAIAATDLENLAITFGDEITFDDEATFNSSATFEAEVAFNDSVEFQGSTEYQDEALFSGDFIVEADAEFSGGVAFGGGLVDIQNGLYFSSGGTLKVPTIAASSVSSPANGMIIYDTGDDTFKGYADGAWTSAFCEALIEIKNITMLMVNRSRSTDHESMT